MDNIFCDDEDLFRAVLPCFWDRNGNLSPAAFFDHKGLSVVRGYYRDENVIINKIKAELNGNIVKLNVGDCKRANTCIKYINYNKNPFHSEIHDSENKVVISLAKRQEMVKFAELIE